MGTTLATEIRSGTDILVRLLDTVGDGTGSSDMSGNFLVPTTFRITPALNEVYYITRVSVNIVASGGLSATGYGSGSTLINGLEFVLYKNGTPLVFPQIISVVNNYDLSIISTNFEELEYQGPDRGLKVTLDYASIGIDSLILSGKSGDKLEVTVSDDFTTRVSPGGQSVSVYGSSVRR